MPLWSYQAMFILAVVATIGSGIWLLLHLTAVTRTLAGNAHIVPSPKRRRATPGAIRGILAVFSIGLIATLSLMILVITGVAQSGLE